MSRRFSHQSSIGDRCGKRSSANNSVARRPCAPKVRVACRLRCRVVTAVHCCVTNGMTIVPKSIDELLTVPGAARKTANVVLGTAFGIASGVVVDTHVQRVSRRLDLTRHSEPVKIEKDLMKTLPESKWILFSHQIIHHGRALCRARKPICGQCRLDPFCYAKDKTV